MENEKLSPVEEAMSALISELDEETLNKAVGGMSQTHKKALISAGLIIAATGAGAGCYWWKRKPKTPNVTKPSGYIPSSNGDRARQMDDAFASRGINAKSVMVNNGQAVLTTFANEDAVEDEVED